MAAGEYNMTIEQGTTFSLVVTAEQPAGTALNLTGYTVASQIRKSYDSDLIETFTTVVTDAAEGEITLSLTPAQTRSLVVRKSSNHDKPASFYVYDLEITSAGGVVTRLLEGRIEVSPEVTR